MSETPSRKPRHALSDTGPAVPVQGGPRDDGAGVSGTAVPLVPEQAQVDDEAAAPERIELVPEQGGPSELPVTGSVSEFPTARSGPEHPAAGAVPAPAGAPDDRPAAVEELPTQVLPVIPRPRRDAIPAARLPEPFRPAPVRGPVPGAGARGQAGGGLGLPELPATVRPVLPAVLGAATALILALGVVAGVNGAPEPPPVPPAPVTTP